MINTVKQEQMLMQIQEVNLDGLEELEHLHIKLKKPTEVYYNMYRMAKQKAKDLKKNAIAAYLEARQIKSAHMLEDNDSDDSDSAFNDDDDDDDEWLKHASNDQMNGIIKFKTKKYFIINFI